MSGEHRHIGGRELAGVFWRSFLLQAAWSFEQMQSLGFAFALEPVLRKLYPGRETLNAHVREHMAFFNTQPYMASFILGAVSRREEDRAGEVTGTELKAALAAPLGALGDSFFWGGVKPLAAVLAVTFLLPGAWWAPLFYLVFYNVWHLGARAGLLLLGYRSGGDISAFLNRFRLPVAAQAFKAITLGMIGCMLGLVDVWMPHFRLPVRLANTLEAVLALLITLVLVALLRKGGSPIKLMIILAAVSLALAFTGVIS